MNTNNNSNTIKFCDDCKTETSKSACSFSKRSYSLPCNILRKIAKKTSKAYNVIFQTKNSDAMPCDFENVIDKLSEVKYFEKQLLSKNIIKKAMLFVCYDDYAPGSQSMEDLTEYEDDFDINKCKKLANDIRIFQTKINDEWFAIPENKEYYISTLKNLAK